MTIGYDPVEYRPDAWNAERKASIIHLDDYPADIDNYYQPEIKLRGNVEASLDALTANLEKRTYVPSGELSKIQAEWKALQKPLLPETGQLVHPLHFVTGLRSLANDDTLIASDIGSNYIWMGRHFFDYEPRKLLFSNGSRP